MFMIRDVIHLNSIKPMKHFRLKTKVVLLLLLSGAWTIADAQPVEFGITGGINISSHLNNFRFTDDDITLNLNPKIAQGFQAGFIIRKQLSKKLRIQAEPSLITLGARYDESLLYNEFQYNTESRTELLYLQLPLLFQLSTTPPERTVYGQAFRTTTYHLTGGFYGGYLIEGRFTGTNSGAPVGVPFEGDFSNNITSQYNEYDGGISLGAGLEHGLDRKLGFETRAWFSIFDSGNAPELNFKPKNMALTFSVYFLL